MFPEHLPLCARSWATVADVHVMVGEGGQNESTWNHIQCCLILKRLIKWKWRNFFRYQCPRMEHQRGHTGLRVEKEWVTNPSISLGNFSGKGGASVGCLGECWKARLSRKGEVGAAKETGSQGAGCTHPSRCSQTMWETTKLYFKCDEIFLECLN